MTTVTTHGAQAHARAQEGATAEAMPVLPAHSWPRLPSEVATAEALVWAETVAGGGYTHKVLARGTIVRLTDLHGDACAHALLYNALEPHERLNKVRALAASLEKMRNEIVATKEGGAITGEERLLQNLNERIRDVRQGPDGALWLLTDNSAGRLLRVSLAK